MLYNAVIFEIVRLEVSESLLVSNSIPIRGRACTALQAETAEWVHRLSITVALGLRLILFF